MKISELQPPGPADALPGASDANTPVNRYPELANVVYRFGVHLRGTEPPIWRLIDRIAVSATMVTKLKL